MTLSNLLNAGLFINNIWIDKNNGKNIPPVAKGKVKVKCKNSGNYCLIPSGIKQYQILAIYIHEIYGDGVYYCKLDDNDSSGFYFLVIKNGDIAVETDCLINKEMLNYLLSGFYESKYNGLKLIELNDEDFNVIVNEYILVKGVFAKKRKHLAILSSGVFLSLSLILLFIADYFLNR